MIVSHRYRFIFLKTNKTAGASIEIALSRFCDSEDIITPLLPDDELIRSNLDLPPANRSIRTLSIRRLATRERMTRLAT